MPRAAPPGSRASPSAAATPVRRGMGKGRGDGRRVRGRGAFLCRSVPGLFVFVFSYAGVVFVEIFFSVRVYSVGDIFGSV